MLSRPFRNTLDFLPVSQFCIASHMSHATSRPAMHRVASGDKLASSGPRPAAHAGIALRARFRQHGLSFGLPSEMWGAASLALQLSKGSAAPALTRAASVWKAS
jgi:hypothetical protein